MKRNEGSDGINKNVSEDSAAGAAYYMRVLWMLQVLLQDKAGKQAGTQAALLLLLLLRQIRPLAFANSGGRAGCSRA